MHVVVGSEHVQALFLLAMLAFDERHVVVVIGKVDVLMVERIEQVKTGKKVLVVFFVFVHSKDILVINEHAFKRIMTPFASLLLQDVKASVRTLTR